MDLRVATPTRGLRNRFWPSLGQNQWILPIFVKMCQLHSWDFNERLGKDFVLSAISCKFFEVVVHSMYFLRFFCIEFVIYALHIDNFFLLFIAKKSELRSTSIILRGTRAHHSSYWYLHRLDRIDDSLLSCKILAMYVHLQVTSQTLGMINYSSTKGKDLIILVEYRPIFNIVDLGKQTIVC